MSDQKFSIIRDYYTEQTMVDRYAQDPTDAVDVIIPIIHTNPHWRYNLHSLFREIPVNRLLIGDGGCVDNSIEIAREFPRVEIHNHRSYKSLGYSIRKLVEEVKTPWFIYPHSDVAFPPGWFDKMKAHQGEFDWFGCPMQITVEVDYRLKAPHRPYVGAQMGRTEAFGHDRLAKIDDDYVYRQEEFVFEKVVNDGGFKCGKVEDTFHYHQVMHRSSPTGRQVETVDIRMAIPHAEQVRTSEMQAKGIVKYLSPHEGENLISVVANVNHLEEIGAMTWHEFFAWVQEIRPDWMPPLKKAHRRSMMKAALRPVRSLYDWMMR